MKRTNIINYLYISASLLFFVLLASAVCADSHRQDMLPEYKIKAVYIYKFIHFIKWSPESLSGENITIGILGKDPFGDSFSEIEGTLIKSLDKKLVIKRFNTWSGNLPLKDCHLLFISSSEKENFKKITQSIRGEKVLTFADTEGFLKADGMIKLIKAGEKIRWEINKIATDSSGIRLNTQIFQCAVKVIK